MDTTKDFLTLVESLVQLILAHHKHSQLPQSPGDPLPTFLAQAEAYIIKVIQPFLPSKETDLCVHHNAKNWTTATVDMLREHYNRVKENAITTIKTLLVPDWGRAFLVASHRARQNNKNIDSTSFELTHTILKDIMSPSFPSLNDLPIVLPGPVFQRNRANQTKTEQPRRAQKTSQKSPKTEHSVLKKRKMNTPEENPIQETSKTATPKSTHLDSPRPSGSLQQVPQALYHAHLNQQKEQFSGMHPIKDTKEERAWK